MKIAARRLWDYLGSSYWFLPGLMALGGGLLVPVMLFIEERFPLYTGYLVRIIEGTGAGGARSILATIAASAIATASVVFSVSVVALSLTSNQFGPRLLKNFLRQGNSQFTLGIFIATFIFCLYGLAFVPDEGTGEPVPHLLVLAGLLAGTMSFMVLIDYIHQITVFIQAPHVIAGVSRSLMDAFTGLPERKSAAGLTPPHAGGPDGSRPVRSPVPSSRWGYVQGIDYEKLIALAARDDSCIDVLTRPGAFTVVGQPLAVIEGAGMADDSALLAVGGCFVMGAEKTAIQDMEYSIEQLVQLAVRALSPGVNDPDTATHCVDHLGAALSVVATRELPPERRLDGEGVCRVRVPRLSYGKILDASFNQIRHHGAGDAAVARRLMEVMLELARLSLTADFAAALEKHARQLHDERDRLSHAHDRAPVEAAYREIEQVFEDRRLGRLP